jgi:DNA-dependent RNA polymerase auxiliary subunit epsilon
MEDKVRDWLSKHKNMNREDLERIIDACLEYDKISLAKDLAIEMELF